MATEFLFDDNNALNENKSIINFFGSDLYNYNNVSANCENIKIEGGQNHYQSLQQQPTDSFITADNLDFSTLSVASYFDNSDDANNSTDNGIFTNESEDEKMKNAMTDVISQFPIRTESTISSSSSSSFDQTIGTATTTTTGNIIDQVPSIIDNINFQYQFSSTSSTSSINNNNSDSNFISFTTTTFDDIILPSSISSNNNSNCISSPTSTSSSSNNNIDNNSLISNIQKFDFTFDFDENNLDDNYNYNSRYLLKNFV